MSMITIVLNDNTTINVSEGTTINDLDHMLEQLHQYVDAVKGVRFAKRDIGNSKADLENAQMQQCNWQRVVDDFHTGSFTTPMPEAHPF